MANRKAYRRSSNAEEKYLDIYLELAERVAVFMLGTFKPSRVEKTFFNTRREISYLQAAMYCSIYYINTNKIPNHFTLIVFWCERRDLSCSHSNGDIFTCEDIKFSRESSPGISLVFM